MSAGTQVVLIAEIFDLVLSNLTATSVSADEPLALARLAQTCRALSEPTLDKLWSNLFSCKSIWNLLPSDAWRIHRSNAVPVYRRNEWVHLRHPTLTRMLVDEDLAAFDRYASRVRTVSISCTATVTGNVSTGASSIFSALCHLRDPIFPHLRDLSWAPSVLYNTLGAFRLISQAHRVPSESFSLTVESDLPDELRSIARRSFHPPVDVDAFTALTGTPGNANFRAMSAWIPRVKTLTLNPSRWRTETGHLPLSNILSGLRALPQLEHLSVTVRLEREILRHLAAAAPSLRSVTGWAEEPGTFKSLEQEFQITPVATFPALEVLEAWDLDVDDVCALLRLVHSSALHTVKLRTEFEPRASFLHILTTRPSPALTELRRTSLRAVSLSLVPPAETEIFACSASALLAPLFDCPNLSSLSLTAYLAISDADIYRISWSWNQLCSLRLYSIPLAATVPHIEAIADLAARCPHLAHIELPVDARLSSAPHRMRLLETFDHRPSSASRTTEVLVFSGRGPFIQEEDVENVVRFLRNTFPRLKCLSGDAPEWRVVWKGFKEGVGS
ncbi:hypothetical protein C8F01DRAFT_1183981 [Mycena amicta]|nr:hypothetical protein C8F01DRAFT_1183981 [Mycena amicta]